jgi:glycine dehydrogenase subunit 1
MRYIPHTESDIKEMLAHIGADRVEDLFRSIPEPLRFEKPLQIPDALSEYSLIAKMKELQKKNLDQESYAVFLGAGAYSHFTPALVSNLVLRGEFSTSYTPYQPEVSQGTLQAIFEFQTMIAMLTGMEVANASMYDGASAVAEAVLMANRITKRNKVLISSAMHPEYRQVVNSFMRGNGIEIHEIPYTEDGKTDRDYIEKNVDESVAAVVLQSPNYFGVIESLSGLKESLEPKGALFVACVTEALSLAILKPPGEHGADIVAAEGQSYGLPVSYGGPYVGLFACKQKYLRQMPGRVCGETVDQQGRQAFTLTLSTREQHIRREKATSNICTNQGLCALAASIYLATMGKNGLKELAELNLKKAHYLKTKLAKISGYSVKFSGETFNEFVLECPKPAKAIQEALLEQNIIAGVPLGGDYSELENGLLVCVTETNSVEEMDRFATALEKL